MTIGHTGPHNGQSATYITEADVEAAAYLGDTLGICALNPSLGICNGSGGGDPPVVTGLLFNDAANSMYQGPAAGIGIGVN